MALAEVAEVEIETVRSSPAMGHFRHELGINWFPIITPYWKSEAEKHVLRGKSG